MKKGDKFKVTVWPGTPEEIKGEATFVQYFGVGCMYEGIVFFFDDDEDDEYWVEHTEYSHLITE